MKKYILSLSVMCAIVSTNAFSSNNPLSEEKAKENFKKEFAGAEAAIWKEAGEYYKVSFLLLGNPVEAYFNAEGELEGTVRFLKMAELPLNILSSFSKRFDKAAVLDIYEVNNAEGTSYRFTFKQDEKKYRVKLDTGGNISEKEKVKS